MSLQDATEQHARFENDLLLRQQKNDSLVPIDTRLLAALSAGLPACAVRALGVDRLLMLAEGKDSLADVVSFDFERV